MILDNSAPFDRGSEITWQEITADHIADSVLATEVPSPILDLTVGASLRKQEPVATTSNGRKLQATPLQITFDVQVTFRSESRGLDISKLVGAAFFTAEDRVRYLDDLQKSGNRVFSTINSVRVEINGVPQEETFESEEPPNTLIFIVMGAVGGAVAVAIVVLLSYLYLRRTTSRRKKSNTVATKSISENPERTNTDIFVEPQDEISTLGDPTYVVGMTMGTVEKDDTVAPSIVSGDYDYAKNYGARPTMPPSVSDSGRASNLLGSIDGSGRGEGSSADLSAFGLAKMDSSLFSDDVSFEQQFTDLETRIEIVAPAGKLGMVIDTPHAAVPVVHAIKETSVLADKVQVGDRLMSVDGEDTTGMTAMQVSKLISLKASKPSRILVFARTRNRTATDDMLAP